MICKVDPEYSLISGRNGHTAISGIQILDGIEKTFIEGISAKKGILVNGGFIIHTKNLPALRDVLTKVIDLRTKETKNKSTVQAEDQTEA